MTNRERVDALHTRMADRLRLREKRRTSALAAGSAGLTLCLILLIFGEGAAHSGGTAGLYTGAAMLFEGAGPYVLVALLAFMAGVCITVFCIRRQRKKANDNKEQKYEKTEDKP